MLRGRLSALMASIALLVPLLLPAVKPVVAAKPAVIHAEPLRMSRVVAAKVVGQAPRPGLYLLLAAGRPVPVLLVPGLEPYRYKGVREVLWNGIDIYEALRENPWKVMSEKNMVEEKVAPMTAYSYADKGKVYIVYPVTYTLNASRVAVEEASLAAVLRLRGASYGLYPLKPLTPPVPLDSSRQVDYKLVDRIHGLEAEYVLSPAVLASTEPSATLTPLQGGRAGPRPLDWWWLEATQELAYSLPWLKKIGDEEAPSAEAGVLHLPSGHSVEVCVPFHVAPKTGVVTATVWALPETRSSAAVSLDAWICTGPSPSICMLTHVPRPRSGVTCRGKPFMVLTTLVGKGYLPSGRDIYFCIYAAASGSDVTLYMHGVGEADFATRSPWSPDPGENTYRVSLSAAGLYCGMYYPACIDAAATASGSLTVPLTPTPTALERPLHLRVHLFSQPGAPRRHIAVYLGDVKVCDGYSTPRRIGFETRQDYVCSKTLTPWTSYSLLRRYIAAGESMPLRIVVDGAWGEEWYLDTRGTWLNYTAVARSFIDGLPVVPGHTVADIAYGLHGFTALYDGSPSAFYAGEVAVKLFSMRPIESRRGRLDVWLDVSGGVYSVSRVRFSIRVSSDRGFSLVDYSVRVPGLSEAKRYASYLTYALTAISIAVGQLPYTGSQVLSTALDVLQNPLVYMLTSSAKASCSQTGPTAVVCTGEARAGLLGSIRSVALRLGFYPQPSGWGRGAEVHYDVTYYYVDGVNEASKRLTGSYYIPFLER